ncbi:tyrosine-type recombinase/integrase [Halorientalis marina]|uniref:tyrosine-type recombinase/integrase n=1 Tax=Halorientalis marina TaxID=2931976 RepID=UPI001FF352D7|nr:tyrosine-type recombinase/integrase [Halorientalis marina]
MTEEPTVARDEVAAAFDRSNDPLAAHAETFTTLDVDPFEVFTTESLSRRDVTDKTVNTYQIAFRHWKTHMEESGRHPACPSEEHVAGFIDYLSTTQDNHPQTIKAKLRRVNEAYEFWQSTPEFPHPGDYNPFDVVRQRVSFDDPDQKELPPLTQGEITTVLESITHRRDQLLILLQLKLGLRATELCNIRLEDLSLMDSTVQSYYSELGTQGTLEGRPNTIYVPHDRDGNKSGRPRVLPLDGEVRYYLTRYLYSRPDVDAGWLFLSKENNKQLNQEDVTKLWKAAFHPMYEETKYHRPVTSHFGRHYFTTYWRVEQELSRPLLQYMRGDSPGTESISDKAGIDHYIHTYYEDIEEPYRNCIYEFLR